MNAPSVLRLNLLRLCYLLLAAGLAVQFWPLLLGAITERSTDGAIVAAMLSALSLVSFLGLVAPLRMLPILLWEIAWKGIWLMSVALPKWLAGDVDPDLQANLFAVSLVAPFVVIFPWRYFLSEIATNRDQWRSSQLRKVGGSSQAGPAAGDARIA